MHNTDIEGTMKLVMKRVTKVIFPYKPDLLPLDFKI